MKHEKPRKVRIIVAFGDISGFTDFCEKITNESVEYDPFMAKFDRLIERTELETGYEFYIPGDGFMCTVDIQDGNCSQKAAEVLIALWDLLKKIVRLIDKKKRNPPAPAGFRIVGAAGYSTETFRRVNEKVQRILRGRHINRAHNYLDLARGKGFVVDDSLKQLVSEKHAKKYGMRFSHLEGSLWVLEIA